MKKSRFPFPLKLFTCFPSGSSYTKYIDSDIGMFTDAHALLPSTVYNSWSIISKRKIRYNTSTNVTLSMDSHTHTMSKCTLYST
jgi:hypothetical protein